jgi:hypothetical protein
VYSRHVQLLKSFFCLLLLLLLLPPLRYLPLRRMA